MLELEQDGLRSGCWSVLTALLTLLSQCPYIVVSNLIVSLELWNRLTFSCLMKKMGWLLKSLTVRCAAFIVFGGGGCERCDGWVRLR